MFNSLDTLKYSFRRAVYSFLKSSAANALNIYHYDINNSDMKPIFNLISEVEEYFDEFFFAFLLAFSISTAISALCYVISIIFVVLDFRKRTMELRKGVWKYSVPRSEISVDGAVSFIGGFISNSVLGFFMIIILYGVLLTPLCYWVFWVILLLYIDKILIFVAPAIAESLLFLVFRKIFSTNHFVTWRL